MYRKIVTITLIIMMLITTNSFASANSKREEKLSVIRMYKLKKDVRDLINTFDGEWSVYIKDLSTDKEIVINNVSMPSASVLKLFILGCTYKYIEDEKLERTDEVSSLMRDMIVVSSNEAANKLIYLIGNNDYKTGIDNINKFIKKSGYSEKTILSNPFQNRSIAVYPDRTNEISAEDCGRFLSKIYHREFLNKKVCDEIEDWMLNQTLRLKIPKAIPEEALVGNKTGETSTIENDSAVIYGPEKDYILCVFSTGWNDKNTAIYNIRDVSNLVYSFMEN